MTIANGEYIIKSDLDAEFQSHEASLIAENKRNCGVYSLNFDFVGCYSSTDSTFKTFTFVAPDDCWLEEFGGTVDHGSSVAWTLALTGVLVQSDISVSVTSSSAPIQFPRYHATGGKPLQVLLKGATYTITLTTAATSGSSYVRGFVLLRALPRRS